MNEVEAFKDYFLSCSHQEQENIITSLLEMMGHLDEQELYDLHQQRIKEKGICCPHCSSNAVVANGKHKGVQTYYCKDCGKYFNETTGTPLAWLKKREKWRTYLRFMLSGYSLRKCGQEAGICLQTSFDWRHKVLRGFKHLAPETFQDVSESDDIFFLHSEKGNKELG